MLAPCQICKRDDVEVTHYLDFAGLPGQPRFFQHVYLCDECKYIQDIALAIVTSEPFDKEDISVEIGPDKKLTVTVKLKPVLRPINVTMRIRFDED